MNPAAQHKTLVWNTLNTALTAPLSDVEAALAPALHDDYVFHGPQPINDQHGVEAVVTNFWQPLRQSFTQFRREAEIFFAGRYRGNDWVTSYGHLVGNFTHDLFGIPATGAFARVRYGEVHRVEEGRIAETYAIYDWIGLMLQAGYRVLPPSRGSEAQPPPPATRDGVLREQTGDVRQSEASYDLVYRMLFKGLNQFDQADKASMGMTRFWLPEMHWYGPAGIGTCLNLHEFEQFHQLPFLHAFPDRACTEQEALFSEGMYTMASGFPGVVATHTGEYLGHPATGRHIDMRVMDWWRAEHTAEGDKLAENWVLIDLIDIFQQFGVDLFARLREQVAARVAERAGEPMADGGER